MPSIKHIQLTELKTLTPTISPVQCDYFVEACMVAFENQRHQSPVQLIVDGDYQGRFALAWDSEIQKKGWQEDRISVENGSIAVAFFLILELTDFEITQQSIIGTGFDYWLGYKSNHPNYHPDNFLNAKLEILASIAEVKPSLINVYARKSVRLD